MRVEVLPDFAESDGFGLGSAAGFGCTSCFGFVSAFGFSKGVLAGAGIGASAARLFGNSDGTGAFWNVLSGSGRLAVRRPLLFMPPPPPLLPEL